MSTAAGPTLLQAVVVALVPLVVAAALALSALALLVTRRIETALPLLLDLLLAAGLLRLEATASWQAIASTVTIVVIRKLANLGIAAGRRARGGSGPGGGAGTTGQPLARLTRLAGRLAR